MTSGIDATKPAGPVAYTADVRANFAAARNEITDLQARTTQVPFLPLNGAASMTGPLILAAASPSAAREAATKQYVDGMIPAGGPFLPLATGGTVAGPTTFGAPGTGLTVSNNASILGTLNVAGVTSTFGTATAVGTTVRISTAVGQQTTLEFFKGTNVRWRIQNRLTAETGLNSGSGLALFGYSDAGALTGTLLFGNRASGPMGNGRPYFSDFAPYDITTPRASEPGGVYGNRVNLMTVSGADAQPVSTLATDPLAVTAGSPTVTVTWPGACLPPNGPGCYVQDRPTYINLLGATAVGGITPTGWLKVQSSPDADHFTVMWTANATSTATGGGAGVTVQPNYGVNGEKFWSNHTAGCGPYSIQKQDVMYCNPPFYIPADGSTSDTVQYQQHFSQLYSPPETTGTKKFGTVGWEADFINRGADAGYQSIPGTGGNSTLGLWLGAIDRVAAGTPGGGTAHNWGCILAIKGQYGTIGTYQGMLITPSALVGAAVDPTGHGGVGFDIFGAYQDLPGNPYATTVGTSTITVTTFGADHTDAIANGDAVYIPRVYTINGVTFGGANYTIANLTGGLTFTIAGTGTASSSGSGGGALGTCSVFFAKQVPYAYTQLWGAWKHGLITNSQSRFESGYLIETQPGNGFAWSDGTGTASVNSVAATVGNLDVVVTPAGTGGVKLAGTRVGFFNAAPAVKAIVSGAKGGNTALGSLIAALVSYGMITDSTSA